MLLLWRKHRHASGNGEINLPSNALKTTSKLNPAVALPLLRRHVDVTLIAVHSSQVTIDVPFSFGSKNNFLRGWLHTSGVQPGGRGEGCVWPADCRLDIEQALFSLSWSILNVSVHLHLCVVVGLHKDTKWNKMLNLTSYICRDWHFWIAKKIRAWYVQ